MPKIDHNQLYQDIHAIPRCEHDFGTHRTEVVGADGKTRVAAAVVSLEGSKKGKVIITLDFERIEDTMSQVRCGHSVKFSEPTKRGKIVEDISGASVLHVGKGGALSITQRRLNLQGDLPDVKEPKKG